MKIFISYSHKDNVFSEKLYTDLEKIGHKIWYDKKNLLLNDSIMYKVVDGIKQTDYYLVIISKNSINSVWVQNELDLAFTLFMEKKICGVIPVIIDDANPPAFLYTRLFVNFSKVTYEDGLSEIIRTLNSNINDIEVMASFLTKKRRQIALIQYLVANHNFNVIEKWEELEVFQEISSGYYAHIHSGRVWSVHDHNYLCSNPNIPLVLDSESPVLRSNLLEIGFGHLRVNNELSDAIYSEEMNFYLPNWRNAVHICGKAKDVGILLTNLCSCDFIEDDIRQYDIPELLTWWDEPFQLNSKRVKLVASAFDKTFNDSLIY
jgi:hypothetical protein